ncbi:MAG TPA: hypothetical protein PLM58_17385, partial [Novosphingobium sp.]|nr:hypothetical protein [Novosphingobium sp.]
MTSAAVSSALVLLLAATYVGYPLVLFLLHSFKPTHRDSASLALPHGFSVTVLIAAYNEQASILHKLQTVLTAADNSPWPVAVIVGDDGSTDATAMLAESIDDPRLTV